MCGGGGTGEGNDAPPLPVLPAAASGVAEPATRAIRPPTALTSWMYLVLDQSERCSGKDAMSMSSTFLQRRLSEDVS